MSSQDRVDPMSSLWAWLAHDLRFYRMKNGLSLGQMGNLISRTRGSVSACEAGRRHITMKEAHALDERFGTGGHFARLLTFARAGHHAGWYQQHLEYEAQAEILKIYGLAAVPGLLQTEAYARVLFAEAEVIDIEEEVAARMARQAILDRADPPEMWVLLDESVIDRPVGGPRVMADQLRRLMKVSELASVVLRVVPRSHGWHVGLDGAFKIMIVRGVPMAYAEAARGGRLTRESVEIRDYLWRFDRIGADALSRAGTRERIGEAINVLESGQTS